MIQASGAKFVRVDVNWYDVETTVGTYDFSTFDNVVSQCSERGIRVLAILDHGNSSLYGTNQNTTSWRNGFTNFAAAAVTRYKGDGLIYELYNEPDNTNNGFASATAYMSFANKVAPAMRKADPNCTIIGPAMLRVT